LGRRKKGGEIKGRQHVGEVRCVKETSMKEGKGKSGGGTETVPREKDVRKVGGTSPKKRGKEKRKTRSRKGKGETEKGGKKKDPLIRGVRAFSE